jgi:hypothetical protein
VIVVPWLVVAAGMVMYGWLLAHNPMLPPLLPSFHFWLYIRTLEWLLAGAGIWWVLATLCRRHPVWTAGLIALVAVAMTVLRLDAYRRRPDFVRDRQIAAQRDPSFGLAAELLRKRTSQDAVVLATYGAAQIIVAPEGRKTVAVHSDFSNPYVPLRQREHDRDLMFTSLDERRTDTFRKLAGKYDVTFVMGVGQPECARLIANTGLLTLWYRLGTVCILHVEP